MHYDFERSPVGGPPFMFFNGIKEHNKKQKISSIKKVPKILFSGCDLLIPGSLREEILDMNIPDLYMHPAVYVDDDDKWYEDYWYMTFEGRLDCWSRENSDYEKNDPIRLGGDELYQIYTYALDEKILNSMPEKNRLLFKMGGSLDPFIVCHESIVRIFKKYGVPGVDFVGVEDY